MAVTEKKAGRTRNDTETRLVISAATRRTATNWAAQVYTWQRLVDRLKQSTATRETASKYAAMSREQRVNVKDVGGYVGGALKAGKRNRNAVINRCLITLDADDVAGSVAEFVAKVAKFGAEAVVHSSHSHTPASPRLRVIMPLSEPVSAADYKGIAQKIADIIGLSQFDTTAFDPEHFMFWPSHPKDAEPFFQHIDGAIIEPGAFLAAKQPDEIGQQAHAQKDPRTKGGPIGEFCRAYDVPAAIDAFLSDVYEPAGRDRYNYRQGSSMKGLNTYEGGLFAYSFHNTDPAGGRLCNAYDLVRIHKFAGSEPDPKTPADRRGERAMIDLIKHDERVTAARKASGQESPADMFDDLGDGAEGGGLKLERTEGGRPKANTRNARKIIQKHLAGALGLNKFSDRFAVRQPLPWDKEAPRDWTDIDEARLRVFIEDRYDLHSTRIVSDVLTDEMGKHAFHPVRDYLRALKWDKKPRLDMLFINLLGAEDTPYTRAVTRKAFTAAVARIMRPGVKYDTMPILTGPQGIGKSMLLKAMARDWFSDSLKSFDGKDAIEGLQGRWLIEIGEMNAFRRSEVDAIKQFLSQESDFFRPSYGKYASDHPRQCVFFGTSNEKQFLRDQTGNRRFWPIECRNTTIDPALRKGLPAELIGLLWAEAVARYKAGEALYLPDELEKAAREIQEQYREDDGKEGIIREFLDKPVTKDWETRGVDDRRGHWRGYLPGDDRAEKVQRARVCAAEIWCECFEGDLKDYRARGNSKDIIRIMDNNMTGWKRCKSRQRCGPYGLQRTVWERVADMGDLW